MKDHIDFYFDTPVNKLEKTEDGYRVICEKMFMNVKDALFLWEEAEANGWRRYVKR